MKKCENCNKDIPATIKIEGKRKSLRSRNLCLICSPYRGDKCRQLTCKKCGDKFDAIQNGKGLYRRSHCLNCVPFGTRLERPDIPEKRICTVCGKEYDYLRRKNKKDKGHKAKTCNSCHTVCRHIARKKRAITYKGGKCACGYDRYYGALEFHHTDPNGKDFQMGGNYSRTWEYIKTELDKCILICANCHRELHDKIRMEKRNESFSKRTSSS